MFLIRSVALLIACLVCTPVLAVDTLVIAPSGYWLLSLDQSGIPQMNKIRDVVRLGVPDDPDGDDDDEDDDDDDDDGKTLKARVELWADKVKEPKAADAQARAFGLVISQASKGTFSNKSEMAAFTKVAITETLNFRGVTRKKEIWQAVWNDKIWPAVRTIEGAGQMNTIADQIRVWTEIQGGLKSNAGFQEAGLWDLLFNMLLELLLEWLRNR